MFGCIAYIHISKTKGGKLDPSTLCGIFMGYDDFPKAYKVFNPPNHKIMIKEDFVFNNPEQKLLP